MRRGYLIGSVCWMGLIWFLSSRPDTSHLLPPLPFGLDKAAHAAVYGVLGFLLARGLGWSRPAALAAVVLAGLWGASDEWHQRFVPGRDAAAEDLLADVFGAALGALASLRWGACGGGWSGSLSHGER